MNAAQLAAELAQVQDLLASLSDAVREGDADAALALSHQLRQRLSPLVRAMPKPTGALADMVQAMRDECTRAQSMLARRQADVDRSLAALSSGTDLQSERVYSAQGTFAPTGRPSRGFARA